MGKFLGKDGLTRVYRKLMGAMEGDWSSLDSDPVSGLLTTDAVTKTYTDKYGNTQEYRLGDIAYTYDSSTKNFTNWIVTKKNDSIIAWDKLLTVTDSSSLATDTHAGLMSAADKIKLGLLDGIDDILPYDGDKAEDDETATVSGEFVGAGYPTDVEFNVKWNGTGFMLYVDADAENSGSASYRTKWSDVHGYPDSSAYGTEGDTGVTPVAGKLYLNRSDGAFYAMVRKEANLGKVFTKTLGGVGFGGGLEVDSVTKLLQMKQVTIDEMDDLYGGKGWTKEGNKCGFYSVVSTKNSINRKGLVVGLLMVSTDINFHGTDQVLFTNMIPNDGKINGSSHNDGKMYIYHRYYNNSSSSSLVPSEQGSWSSWTEMLRANYLPEGASSKTIIPLSEMALSNVSLSFADGKLTVVTSDLDLNKKSTSEVELETGLKSGELEYGTNADGTGKWTATLDGEGLYKIIVINPYSPETLGYAEVYITSAGKYCFVGASSSQITASGFTSYDSSTGIFTINNSSIANSNYVAKWMKLC